MTVRTLAFGEVEIGIWGSAWDLGDGRSGFTAVGAGGEAAVLDPTGQIELSDDEAGTWWLASDDLELESLPEGEAATLPDGFDQLVRVRGRLRAGGADYEIDCLGTRASRAEIELSRLESIRGVSAWFGPDLGLAVVSARPRGAAGHDQDHITASLFEHGLPVTIDDPRLSTTYTEGGIPARASVEVWLEPDESDATAAGQEPPEPRPRRMAGESIGPVASRSEGQLKVLATPFRWHAEGREGAGVYALTQPR
jgi:hypothetical protein